MSHETYDIYDASMSHETYEMSSMTRLCHTKRYDASITFLSRDILSTARVININTLFLLSCFQDAFLALTCDVRV